MEIEYKLFDIGYLKAITELQNEWTFENNTFGVVEDKPEDILNYKRDYFYIALDGACDKVVGYITAEIINNNEFNIFPKGASYLRVNDLYISKEYRNNKIGEGLLSVIEKKAAVIGLQHIFISSAAKDSSAVRNFYEKSGYAVWTTMFYKRNNWDVRVYPFNELLYYRYVVIFARYREKWVFCRHKNRNTFETAGGHIEKGEVPEAAAKRELFEETGAVEYNIYPMFDYSVYTPESFANGQAYFADITELDDLPKSEMEEVRLFDAVPESMTYPYILPVLFEKAEEFLNKQILCQ